MKNAPAGKLERTRETTCRRFAATLALKRLAKMWTTPILLILSEGPRRFAELERELAPISAKVLTQRLKELERQGFVARLELVSEPPKTVIDRLTEEGEEIRPVLEALQVWSERLSDRARRSG